MKCGDESTYIWLDAWVRCIRVVGIKANISENMRKFHKRQGNFAVVPFRLCLETMKYGF
jgi:hypothetical protein